jgi:hypothetical protein
LQRETHEEESSASRHVDRALNFASALVAQPLHRATRTRSCRRRRRRGITSDLFPGVELEESDHGPLLRGIAAVCADGVPVAPGRPPQRLQPNPTWTQKVQQLYEMVSEGGNGGTVAPPRITCLGTMALDVTVQRSVRPPQRRMPHDQVDKGVARACALLRLAPLPALGSTESDTANTAMVVRAAGAGAARRDGGGRDGLRQDVHHPRPCQRHVLQRRGGRRRRRAIRPATRAGTVHARASGTTCAQSRRLH